jgi:hypothetical protein
VQLYGEAGNDTLIGKGGGDFLFGGSGADILDSGFGCDVLIGGVGADQFRFTTSLGAGNIDTLQDFSVADGIGSCSAAPCSWMWACSQAPVSRLAWPRASTTTSCTIKPPVRYLTVSTLGRGGGDQVRGTHGRNRAHDLTLPRREGG